MDDFKVIYNMQKRFQEELGYDFATMSDEARVNYISEYVKHLHHEIGEMLQELPFFKSWKQYPADPIVRGLMFHKAWEEWADVLHFFLNVTIGLGLTPDDLYSLYHDKQLVNHTRQLDSVQYKKCVEGTWPYEVTSN